MSDQTTSANRDSIRGAIFGAKPKSTKVVFFGQEIEIRQPTIGSIMDNANAEEDQQSQILRLIIANSYLPGTNTKVFEEGDFDNFRELPFGDDMQRMTQAASELVSIIPTEAAKSTEG